MKEKTLEIVYKWPSGKEDVRYRRPYDSDDARQFIKDIDRLRKLFSGYRYSYRII